MEAAMNFLAETDETYAEAKTNLLRSEILCKRIRARVFTFVEGNIETRKAQAEGHQEVVAADDEYIKATLAFESLKARRSRAEILMDVWRTLEASRRRT
jgi:hypothetical protein